MRELAPGLSAKNLSVSKRLHTSTPLGSMQFIVFGFGERATLSQAARSGLIVVILADSSASTPMKYLDDFVDSLGVVDHSMAAGDDACAFHNGCSNRVFHHGRQ
jgi:hypothetical protein